MVCIHRCHIFVVGHVLSYQVCSVGMCTGAGYIININEVGGIYSGILFGISNTFATLPGIIAPYIVGVLTPNVNI